MRFKLSQLWQTQQHFQIDLLTARHQVNTPGWSTVLLQASTPASSNGKTTSAHNKQAVRTHQLLLCSTSTLLCYQTLSSTSVINAMSTKRTQPCGTKPKTRQTRPSQRRTVKPWSTWSSLGQGHNNHTTGDPLTVANAQIWVSLHATRALSVKRAEKDQPASRQPTNGGGGRKRQQIPRNYFTFTYTLHALCTFLVHLASLWLLDGMWVSFHHFASRAT